MGRKKPYFPRIDSEKISTKEEAVRAVDKLRKAVRGGLVKSLPDIYRLGKDDLLKLPGYAETSAENLLKEIEKAKKVTLSRLLYALGITLLGSHMVRVVAERFRDLGDLEKADEKDLQQIDEVGPEVARSIVSFFADKKNSRVLTAMIEAGVVIDNPDYLGKDGDFPLQDLKFVFTGSLDNWTRDEVKKLIERYGGRATSRVLGETDYLVVGPGSGGKLDEAAKLDIPVLHEKDFVSFLKKNGIPLNDRE